ncbi:hypothetical protein C5O72_13530 [Muribaculum intestinale]|nr:hypothetical protein ADH68_02885 [Muribaculum intestinale]PWB06388.1 hypothetical protein C5O72_13530 [Muribaculum intestinale]
MATSFIIKIKYPDIMRFLYSLILSFTSFSIMAQQWVIDEIADEQKTSDSIPGWLIVSRC